MQERQGIGGRPLGGRREALYRRGKQWSEHQHGGNRKSFPSDRYLHKYMATDNRALLYMTICQDHYASLKESYLQNSNDNNEGNASSNIICFFNIALLIHGNLYHKTKFLRCTFYGGFIFGLVGLL